jgi:predicted transcriptional regulator
MIKVQIHLREEEFFRLQQLARGTSQSVSELIRQAIRGTWFSKNACGPVALWRGEVRTQANDHDGLYDDP